MLKRTVTLLCILLFPGLSFAQGQLLIGSETVEYTESLVTEGVRLYFVDGTVVASEHDTDANGVADVWLVYEADHVRLEGHDTNGDGEPDTLLSIDSAGNITGFSGLAADKYKSGDRSLFSESPERAVGEWVAEKSRSDATEEAGGNWVLLGVLGLFVVVALYLATSRRR